MRVLVDTNVFLDYILNRPPFGQEAREFFGYFLSHRHQIVVSPMTFRDIEYVLRKVDHDEFSRERTLRRVYSVVYKIIDLNPDDVINALFGEYKDFEDGMIMESAERKLLDGIVTNNVRDFQKSKVPVFTPRELREALERNE